MAKVNRAEKLLNKVAARTGMSDEGLQWIKAAIDPFHDGPLMVQGYPDMSSGNSVVQCVKLQTTLSNPGVTGSDKWDCVLRTSNFLTNTNINSYATNNNVIVSPGGDVTSTGGLEIFSGKMGQNLQTSSATNYLDSSLSIPDSLIKRRLRVIAQGFEVHNVTEELNKNGSVTTFMQEQSTEVSTWGLGNIWVVASGKKNIPQKTKTSKSIEDESEEESTTFRSWGSMDVTAVQNIPASEGQALLLGGSRTWDAAQGCYCVPTMNSMENPPKFPSSLQPMMVTNVNGLSLDSGFPDFTDDVVSTSLIDFGVGEYLPGPTQMQFPIPWNSVGAYFTGLSQETVLKVTYNVFIERFPSELDTDLILLARPTASFDSKALDTYAEAMAHMPVGVPVCENGLGDWFVDVAARVVDGLTGTRFASGLLQAGNEIYANTNSNNANGGQTPMVQNPSTYVNTDRTVAIRRKPLPPIPKKRKPLPPTPQKKGGKKPNPPPKPRK